MSLECGTVLICQISPYLDSIVRVIQFLRLRFTDILPQQHHALVNDNTVELVELNVWRSDWLH